MEQTRYFKGKVYKKNPFFNSRNIIEQQPSNPLRLVVLIKIQSESNYTFFEFIVLLCVERYG